MRLGALALLSAAAFGQSFDIADVHPSAHAANLFLAAPLAVTGGVLRGGRYDLRNSTFLDLIQRAYGIDNSSKIFGGPNWLNTDRFDIAAKAPQSTPPETVKLMLRALLAERFKLVVHNDTRPLPAYILSAGKVKPKLKPADASGEAGCVTVPQSPAPGEIPYNVFSCHNLTMEDFAAWLRRTAGDLGGSAVDHTGLKESWDFDIKWITRRRLAVAGAEGMTVFDAVDRQLGLKLELQQAALPVVVVDRVNRKPTDNPPGVAAILPPPPVAFEVASIRPSAPGTQLRGDVQNGRVDWKAWSLRSLIFIAWNIGGSNDMLVGPKFLESAKFDIVAKTAAQQIDDDDEALRPMLRALLVERFKLTTHIETRPVNVFTLTAAKPKLQRANTARRSECKEGPGDDGKDPRAANPLVNRLVTCRNTTMTQLAERLQGFGRGYIESSVLEDTWLDGAYDFTLGFSAADVLQSGGNGPDSPGALSLFDAIDQQLGLKLERRKRPVPVLVIDHIEEKPSDN